MSAISKKMIESAAALRDAAGSLKFAPPVAFVYNPLEYAWAPHQCYLSRFATSRKRVVLMGMNPGPFGMAQTGVPFGEIAAVRNWMGIDAPVGKPPREHPKRPVEGFQCAKSEVSGRRLWGLFAETWPDARDFFADHFVLNYCPLVFMEASGRNLTPDKLPAAQAAKLFAACDAHLKAALHILQPEWAIGVGSFALKRIEPIARGASIRTGAILHPSPASPAANRGWAQQATRQLRQLGVWR